MQLRAKRLQKEKALRPLMGVIKLIGGYVKYGSPVDDQINIVADLIAGKRGAFEGIIRQYGARLLLKATQMLGNTPDAEECVQECYLQVHRNISSFRGEANLYSWMYRILVNACLKKMKTRAVNNSASIESLLPDFDDNNCRIEPNWPVVPTAEEVLRQNNTKRQVLAAIHSLPNSYRDILYLRDIEGYNTAEVAQKFSLSEGAIKVRLHRARSALKKILEPVFLEGLEQ